jgi:hypothetical protein
MRISAFQASSPANDVGLCRRVEDEVQDRKDLPELRLRTFGQGSD